MSLAALVYFLLLALWSGVVSYLFLFKFVPYITKKPHTHTPPAVQHAPKTSVRPPRRFSPHQGFSSLAKGDTLTVEDIVKAFVEE